MLARCVTIMRTFVPFIGGVAEMKYREYAPYSVVGGISWVASMTLLGYFLGHSPLGEKIHLIVMVIIAISLLPMLIGFLRRYFTSQD